MKFGIVVFPGSSGDSDCFYVIDQVLKEPVEYLWHNDADLKGVDCVILPGGFSYGDYLRPGAIARFAPIMEKVIEFGQKGGLILGIGNGFQILTEAGMLPGALISNNSLRFQHSNTYLRVERADTAFTLNYEEEQIIQLPIAHSQGNYVVEPQILARMEKEKQIIFRYCNAQGETSLEANPNGSVHNIAGIVNERGNILGMMPHPERCADEILGGEIGLSIFKSLLDLSLIHI